MISAMSSIKNFILFNIARFNRLRRKPLPEILMFIIKRARMIVVHIRDLLLITLNQIRLNDKQFIHELSLKDPAMTNLNNAVVLGYLEKAKKELVNNMRNRDAHRFFFNRGEKKKIITTLEEQYPKSIGRTIDLADEFVIHKFQFLGKKVHFKGNIDWHSSITSNKRWPLSFSPNIDYFSNQRIGDIKLAWELNRCQHFVILGKAFWFTGDERYVIEFQNQLLSWIEDNPYKRGINWMEGIEVSIRLISWIWAYVFFLDSRSFKDEAHYEFLKSVYLQTKFIEEHLSDKWQLNNNHLIAEAVGLIYVGIMFPEFKEAEKWKDKGFKILEKELVKQILHDGVTWEQSTGYHLFVTDLVLHVVILAKKNEIQIPETILVKLEQMIEFLNQITKTDGVIPLIGDEDGARVLKIDETAYDDARSTITIGSIIFNRKDWLRVRSEEAFWLFGTSTLDKEQLPIFQSSKLFKHSGYCIMHGKNKYLLFTTSPQDKKHLHSVHKHIDMLNFVLDAYGTYFIVDPGTYTYYGDFKWRKRFRSIKSHNTVVIDEDEIVQFKEIFELPSIPISKIQEYSINDKYDFIIAKHNGYKNLSHTRIIVYIKPEYWIIIDVIEGKGNHIYDLYFHLNHNLKLIFDQKNQNALISSSTAIMEIAPLLNNDLKGEILEGEVSNKYGVKIQAPTIRYRKSGKTPQFFVTALYPYLYYNSEEKNNKIVKTSQIDVFDNEGKKYEQNEAIGIKIELSNFKDYIIYNHSEKKSVSFFRSLEGLNYVMEQKDFII